MRRKLIQQNAFDQIINESVTNSQFELAESLDIVAKALGRDNLKLRCFNDSKVVYETTDQTFLHAGYEIKNEQITLNNIEELVIDESSRQSKMRTTISEMLEAVYKDEEAKATDLFKNIMGMTSFNEASKKIITTDDGGVEAKDYEEEEKAAGDSPFTNKPKSAADKAKSKLNKKEDSDAIKNKKEDLKKRIQAAGDDVAEAYYVAGNVLDYCKYTELGPALKESVSKTDENGNVTDLKIPTNHARNEGKILNFNWKTLNHKVKVLRDKASKLAENQEFCKAVASLKKQNAVSDAQGLEEALDHIVQNWGNVLYVTQDELAQTVGEALQLVGEKNYDDQTCAFMAEGILRRAFEAYTEHVQEILHLASAPKVEAEEDAYIAFQNVVESFYSNIDEKFGLEKQVFADLYESVSTIWKKADRQGNAALKNEAASFIDELAYTLNGDIRPEIGLANEAAHWLKTIIETNLETGVWNVSNKPHMTINGDHPDMGRKAAHGYAPSKDFSGNWGDSAPAISQDNMSYKNGAAKEMRSNSWGNIGGDTYPTLSNPHTPKPFGDYTMKGEKGVDKDTFGQHHGSWQSGDTWPALNNPYVPNEKGGTGGTGYKAKTDNLVVDK